MGRPTNIGNGASQMSDTQSVNTDAKTEPVAPPEIRKLEFSDIKQALSLGTKDFKAAPMFGLFFGAIYAVGGWFLFILLAVFSLPYLVYPLATGFALIAPFVAAGLYDVSRRREQGLELSWSAVLGSIRSAGRRDLGWMALVTGFALIVWMDIAAFLFFGFIGFRPPGIAELLTQIFTTTSGLIFLFIGNLSGAILALAVFSISVVSVPLLFDRKVDFVTAMVTSVKCVRANPGPMLAWCIIIGLLLVLAFATALVGMLVVLPILGHATWHLYKRAVA